MKCELEIEFESEKSAKNAEQVIKSESIERDRSSFKVETKGKTLVVVISANDIAALKASVNNNLRLISVVMAVK